MLSPLYESMSSVYSIAAMDNSSDSDNRPSSVQSKIHQFETKASSEEMLAPPENFKPKSSSGKMYQSVFDLTKLTDTEESENETPTACPPSFAYRGLFNEESAQKKQVKYPSNPDIKGYDSDHEPMQGPHVGPRMNLPYRSKSFSSPMQDASQRNQDGAWAKPPTGREPIDKEKSTGQSDGGRRKGPRRSKSCLGNVGGVRFQNDGAADDDRNETCVIQTESEEVRPGVKRHTVTFKSKRHSSEDSCSSSGTPERGQDEVRSKSWDSHDDHSQSRILYRPGSGSTEKRFKHEHNSSLQVNDDSSVQERWKLCPLDCTCVCHFRDSSMFTTCNCKVSLKVSKIEIQVEYRIMRKKHFTVYCILQVSVMVV